MKQYYCESATQRTTSTQKTYFSLMLNDSVEKISVSMWDAPSSVKTTDLQGRVLNVMEIQEKNGYKNVSWSSISAVDKDAVPADSPLRKIKTESEITTDQILKAVEAFKPLFPERWKAFVESLDLRAFVEDFGISPAGKEVHHTIKGGLREHVYEMLAAYYKLSQVYFIKPLRHEFVVLGILFHDFGKTLEYDPETREVKEEMSLLGHIFIGAHRLMELMERYNAKQSDQSLKLSTREMECATHCVLAHHSQQEWGSPVVPAIPEAWLLYSVDEISSKCNQFANGSHMQKSFFLGTNIIKETV